MIFYSDIIPSVVPSVTGIKDDRTVSEVLDKASFVSMRAYSRGGFGIQRSILFGLDGNKPHSENHESDTALDECLALDTAIQ
jgi:hypothetical protein